MYLNWNNISSIPSRWMMRYLQNRGWIAFYWDGSLDCKDPDCVIHLYRAYLHAPR